MSDGKTTTRLNQLREQMLVEKGFLRSLYDAISLQKRKDLLSFGSVVQINLVLKICHELCNGNIPLDKKHFSEITRRKKIGILMKGLQRNTDYRNLLLSSRTDKLTYLFKICSVLYFIMHPLFNRQIQA